MSGPTMTVNCADYERMRKQNELMRKGIVELQNERDAALAAIKRHNDECQHLCGEGDQEAVKCGYRPYFEFNSRRCSDCPTKWIIDTALVDAERYRVIRNGPDGYTQNPFEVIRWYDTGPQGLSKEELDADIDAALAEVKHED